MYIYRYLSAETENRHVRRTEPSVHRESVAKFFLHVSGITNRSLILVPWYWFGTLTERPLKIPCGRDYLNNVDEPNQTVFVIKPNWILL